MAYQDFTTYTEVDSNGYWSQTTPRNTFSGLQLGDNSYVYKDFGSGNFSGDFEHYFEFQRTSGTGGIAGIWGLTNTPSQFIGYIGIYFLLYLEGIFLGDTISGFSAFNFTALPASTTYYVKLWRTGSSLQVKVYTSASDRTSDINDIRYLTVNSVDTATNYQYLQAGYSYGAGGTPSISGYIENLDLSPGSPSQETFEGTDIISLADFTTEQETEEEAFTIGDDIEVYAINKESFNNKINLVKEEIIDFAQKINTAIRSVNIIANVINTINGLIATFDNDIRVHSETTDNVNNDVRVLASYQVPGDAGFQSLGKSYIKVYIDSVEQTDVNIDSMTINKVLNETHTASFELGRAYDSSKPSIEATVLIKYNEWLLYKGYISSITPASSPESIRINCSNKHWKSNREKSYFFVGHKPRDNKEKYYNRISTALSSAFGWSPGIGNFIPQNMNFFGTGESDAISQLITSSGNFAWYYDENENQKLWQAGRGNIINLERQEIDKNLGLYQVLKHQFSEIVSDIINKLRVQMGNKVIRRFNDTGANKEYTTYEYRYVQLQAVPNWDAQYERLAKNSEDIDGYGWDYHPTTQNDLYKDVFKKFNLPFLDKELESWTDIYPPEVSILIPFSLWWEASVDEGILTEGFAIDYEEGKITFNEPIYLFEKNDFGENENIRAPHVMLRLGKKTYHSNTEDENDDPESDISNPLMFFTSKVGSYATTVIGSLSLTNLSIQRGGSYRNTDGEKVVIPSWNDTAFAQDYSYWQLSNSAYKKVVGSIDLTLDTIVAYGMNLSHRVNIDNVTEGALNIISMSYNMSSFTVNVQLEDKHYYKRTVSIPSHGE